MREFYISIDTTALQQIADAFKTTPQEYERAFERAARRTAGTFRRLVARERLGIEDLARTVAIRRRIKALFRRDAQTRDGIWFGLNDLWASEFKGTPKQTRDGVAFRGQFYPKAFRIRRRGNRKYRIFRRVNGKVKEITIPINKKGIDYIEHNILPELPDAFYNHFLQEVKRQDIRKRS